MVSSRRIGFHTGVLDGHSVHSVAAGQRQAIAVQQVINLAQAPESSHQGLSH